MSRHLIKSFYNNWSWLISAVSNGSVRRMGTKMTERSPGELHTYNINREGSKAARKISKNNPSREESISAMFPVLQYFSDLIDDNPITISSRNAAVMFTRLGRTEPTARLGSWWFDPPQLQVLQKIGSLLRKQTFRCTAEDMVTALWGMGFLGPMLLQQPLNKDTKFEFLVHDLINRVIGDASKLRPVDLTILVEAMARLQYKNVPFVMKAVSYETKSKISRFSDGDIARYLWSLAQMGYPNRRGVDKDALLSTLAWECKKRVSAMNGVDLSRIVWAFGVLRFTPIQHLLSMISGQYIEAILLKGDACVKLLWGFQHLDHHPGKGALTKLGRSFAKEIDTLLPRDIVTGFLSLVHFGLVDDRVPTRLKELILRAEVGDWTPREAANLIWALARADFLEQDTFMILRRYLLDCQPEELPAQHQVDIYRCFLHLHMFRPSMARFLPASTGEKCQKAWIEHQQRMESSPVLPEVMDALRTMGYTVETNTPIQGGILFGHTASSKDDLAVEILHPPHNFINEQKLASEGQFWREDLLLSWGWKVIRVDEKGWSRIKDEKDKTEFLKLQIERS